MIKTIGMIVDDSSPVCEAIKGHLNRPNDLIMVLFVSLDITTENHAQTVLIIELLN